jgi:hypothetical protein
VAAWLFNNTGGSVLLTMLLHAAHNTGAAFFGAMFTGAGLARLGWLRGAFWCVAAIVVVIMGGPAHLCRRHSTLCRPVRSPAPSSC